MVGILLSFWDGLFSGSMLVLGREQHSMTVNLPRCMSFSRQGRKRRGCAVPGREGCGRVRHAQAAVGEGTCRIILWMYISEDKYVCIYV